MKSPAKKPRRKRDPEATKALILDAVIDTIYEKGFYNAPLVDILKRAGVRQGTLQYHFPTKSDLQVGAMRHLLMRIIGLFPQGGESVPIEQVAERMAAMFNTKEHHVLLEFWIAARTDDDLREAMTPLYLMTKTVLESKENNVADDKSLDAVFLFHVLRSLSLDQLIGFEANSEQRIREYIARFT